MNLAIAIIGAVAAVAAAIAAFGAWNAAMKANGTTRSMAAIERDRRHDELTPNFDVTCATRGAKSHLADLQVALKPGRLESLDGVIITILDETGQDHWGHGLPNGVTQEEAEAFVWGGWEFNTGASEQVVSNRTTKARSYSVVTGKNWDFLSLRRTRPGLWMTGTSTDEWQKQYSDKPIRLLFTCRRDGFEPWIVLYEVQAEGPPKSGIRVSVIE